MRAPDRTDACWMDGRRIPVDEARVPLHDTAVLAGLGLFETIALRAGRLLELDSHLERLARGAQRLDLRIPPLAGLGDVAREAAGEGAPPCGWLKIVVTGGGSSFVFRGAMDPAEEGRISTAVLVPWRRNAKDALAGLKTLNYAGNLLGLEFARQRGADEGLWLNTRGHLAEGCTSNLFVMRGRRLFTPGLGEGILPGVVRGLTIAAARRLGCAVHEGRLRLPRLEGAGEAFLTSSLRGLRPLVGFAGRPVGKGEPGAWTRRIAAEVARQRRVGGESTSGAPAETGR